MSDRSDSTEQLFARFRDGDPEAFRTLVSEHVPALHRRADRWLDCRVRKKVSLRDVVQDAQLIAYERRGSFDPRGPDSLRAWLLGIVDNCARAAIEHYAGTQQRSPERELTGEHRPLSGALPDGGPSPSQVMLGDERRRLLREARARLSASDQEILRLVHDEQMTLREVAERSDRPYGAVRKQHARALHRLAQAFRKPRYDEHD